MSLCYLKKTHSGIVVTSAANKDSKESNPLQNDYLATLGVVRTPGGLEAINLRSKGSPMFAPVSDGEEAGGYWLSDIICTKSLDTTELLPGVGMDVFVWGIHLVNGEILSWSVPYMCEYHSEVSESFTAKATPWFGQVCE